MNRRRFFKALGTVALAGLILRAPLKISFPAPLAVPNALRVGEFPAFTSLIARVWPQTPILADLVSVQPMPLPSGQCFYSDFKQSWWIRALRRVHSTWNN